MFDCNCGEHTCRFSRENQFALMHSTTSICIYTLAETYDPKRKKTQSETKADNMKYYIFFSPGDPRIWNTP